MTPTTFTHKFKAGSKGRELQQTIRRLEDSISRLEAAMLVLTIGDSAVMIGYEADKIELNGEEYYKPAPFFDILDLTKVSIKYISSVVVSLYKQLNMVTTEYNHLIAE